jgi:hypothetical protein
VRAPRRARADDRDKALVEYLRRAGAGSTLEEIRRFQELAFATSRGHGTNTDVPLHAYLANLANAYLRVRNGELALRDEDPLGASNVGRWRWLTLLIPADLLACGFHPEASLGNRRVRLTADLPELEREWKVAETHVHLSAALGFEDVWERLAGRALEPDFKIGAPEGSLFGGAERFRRYLLMALIARSTLAEFLTRPRDKGFADFAEGSGEGALGVLWTTRLGGNAMIEWTLHLRALSTLAAPDEEQVDSLSWSELQRVYSMFRLGRSRLSDPNDILTGPFATLSELAGVSREESALALDALRYLHGRGHADRPFEQLFWQYERVRCCLYHCLTIAPGTSGLDWLQRHYHNMLAIRGERLAPRDIATAFEHESEGVNLRSLEVRAMPHRKAEKTRNLVRDVARAATQFSRPCEVGVVLHFLKTWRDPPGEWPTATRVVAPCLGEYYQDQMNRARAIEKVLGDYPALLLVLRGIDVAGAELAIPTWVFLPILEVVRRAARRAATKIGLAPDVRPICVTFHAGEEATSLAEGLRRIAEVLQFVGPDRLGHAVALGMNPAEYHGLLQEFPQPCEDRLDDLLWEAEYCNRDVRMEAEHLGSLMHGRWIPLWVLIAARHLRFDAGLLARLNFPRHPSAQPNGDVEKAFYEYLYDPAVRSRARHPVSVACQSSEWTALRQAQVQLRRHCADRGIVVEANLSSNLVVAGLASFLTHPCMRINPPPSRVGRLVDRLWGALTHRYRVPVSLNTDDPAILATRLCDEYAYALHGLHLEGIRGAPAKEWLNSARAVGWNSRFTLSQTEDPAYLAWVAGEGAAG